MNIADLPDRLASKIEADASGCWLWNGATTPRGYSNTVWQGRNAYAHRVVFHLLADPALPVNPGGSHRGMQLDHLCERQNCVNPAHLEPVTHAENQRRRAERHPRPTSIPADDPRHGSRSTYEYWRCRCAPCCAAEAAYGRARRVYLRTPVDAALDEIGRQAARRGAA